MIFKPWNVHGNWADVEELTGKTFKSVIQTTHDSSDAIVFEGDDVMYMLHHRQECCESVMLEEVVGELSDLEGSPITMAELVTDEGEEDDDYFTWSFYKFATVKGYVTLRWYGTSNGYYSESVDFIKREPYAMTYDDLHARMLENYETMGRRSPTVYIVNNDEYADLCEFMRHHHGLKGYGDPPHITINYDAGQIVVVPEAFSQKYTPVSPKEEPCPSQNGSDGDDGTVTSVGPAGTSGALPPEPSAEP